MVPMDSKYKYFSLAGDDAAGHKQEELFTFHEDCVRLNEDLKDSYIWLLYMCNILTFYFICLICPIAFRNKNCGDSTYWVSHLLYGLYSLGAFIMESLVYRYIVKTINNKDIVAVQTSDVIPLVLSQITRMSLYLDMLYFTNVLSCGNYNLGISSIICLGFYMVVLIGQLLTIFSEYMDTRRYHRTTFINLLAKFSYNGGLLAVAGTLERLATSCTMKVGRRYVPQILVVNILKFVLESLPHAVLQLYSVSSNTLSLNEAVFITSSIFSLLNMMASFYLVITVQPSICTAVMVKQLAYKKYRHKLQVLSKAEEEEEEAKKWKNIEESKKKGYKPVNQKEAPMIENITAGRVDTLDSICFD